MGPNRPALFKGRHFEAAIIVLCVRWHLRFGLSFRNLGEVMAERSLHVDNVTIWRRVQRYAPELNRRCLRELHTTNGSWRVDETCTSWSKTTAQSNDASVPARDSAPSTQPGGRFKASR